MRPSPITRDERSLRRLERLYDQQGEAGRKASQDNLEVKRLLRAGVIDKTYAYELRMAIRAKYVLAQDLEREARHKLEAHQQKQRDLEQAQVIAIGIFLLIIVPVLIIVYNLVFG